MPKPTVHSSEGQTLISTGYQSSVASTGPLSESGSASCTKNAIQVQAESDVAASATTPAWASALLFMTFLLVLLICIGVFLSSFKQYEFSKGVYTAIHKSGSAAAGLATAQVATEAANAVKVAAVA